MAKKLSEFINGEYRGYTGSRGFQGVQGPQGTIGFQGIQGTRGFTGSTGLQGVQGTNGIQGIQGTSGNDGTDGLLGYTGSQGQRAVPSSFTITGTELTTGTPFQPNVGIYDQFNIVNLDKNITIGKPTGTVPNGFRMVIRIKSSSTATRNLGWDKSTGGYREFGIILPTGTLMTKTTYIGAIWNSNDNFWDVVAMTTEN